MKSVQRVQIISNVDQIFIEIIMVKTYYKPKTIIAVLINGGNLLQQIYITFELRLINFSNVFSSVSLKSSISNLESLKVS